MNKRGRITGDDSCFVACPDGPPPTCPKAACHRALLIFERDIAADWSTDIAVVSVEPERLKVLKKRKKA